jgi:hypothetical protein
LKQKLDAVGIAAVLQIAKHSECVLTNMIVERLLVPNLCPQDIVISEWYFKGKAFEAADVDANAGANKTNGKSFIGSGMRHMLSSNILRVLS